MILTDEIVAAYAEKSRVPQSNEVQAMAKWMLDAAKAMKLLISASRHQLDHGERLMSGAISRALMQEAVDYAEPLIKD